MQISVRERYEAMSTAIKKTGRPMLFSMCEWGVSNPWLYGKQVGYPACDLGLGRTELTVSAAVSALEWKKRVYSLGLKALLEDCIFILASLALVFSKLALSMTCIGQ